MRILIDLDGVVADWGKLYDIIANQFRLDLHGGIPYAERPVWDLYHGLDETGRKATDAIMSWPNFYMEMKPIPGALAGVRALIEAGHEIFFVSTPSPVNHLCASQKYEWVEKWLGMGKRVILTHDKTLVSGDVLIDDKPLITGAQDPEWTHLCFGEYGYSALTGSARVRNWQAVIDEVNAFAREMEYV